MPLSPELESRLRREAERKGVSVDALMLELLDKYLPQDSESRRAAAVEMLQSWAEEDAALSDEVAADNAALLRELDEHRSSYRKLFEGLLRDRTGDSTGQAQTLSDPLVVATANVGHLSRFVSADLWQNIKS